MKHLVRAAAGAALLAFATPAPAAQVSGATPFAPACNGAPQSGTEYRSAELEPWAAIRPGAVSLDAAPIIGAWQQDRWSDGGSNGLAAGRSTDGGATWTTQGPGQLPPFARCQGGNVSNGGNYERATDPWVSVSPNGTAYFMSLAFNASTPGQENAMQVSRSTDGGASWGPISTLISDTHPTAFNDKNSLTADPYDSRYAYAVWDRLVYPSESAAKGKSWEEPTGFYGPTWMARTTNGGQSWEPGRKIYDPATDGAGQGRNDQTIGNQIVVLPNGDLLDVFDLIHNDNSHKRRGSKVAVIRSTDHGRTWDTTATIVAKLDTVGVTDPTTGTAVRTGDIIPEVAVDQRTGAVYVVWQDGRWSGGAYDEVAFAKSTDGGVHWSSPQRINTPSGGPAFNPAIRVLDDGTVGVLYSDFRSDTPEPTALPTDEWLTTLRPGATGWNEQHVDGPFNLQEAAFARGYFLGDYVSLTSAGNEFLAFYAVTGGVGPSDIVAKRLAP